MSRMECTAVTWNSINGCSIESENRYRYTIGRNMADRINNEGVTKLQSGAQP
jgi:protein gp37